MCSSDLQVIYLDSGANKELAAPYGVSFEGSLADAVAKLQKGYQTRLRNAPEHPYDIGPVADRYLEVFTRAIEQGPVS